MRSSEHDGIHLRRRPATKGHLHRTGDWGTRLFVVGVLMALGDCSSMTALAATSNTTAPPAIRRVEVSGAHVLSPRAVQRILSPPFPADSLEARLRRLGRRYYDLGHLDAVLEPERDPEGVLHLSVVEGHPASIAQVYIRGLHALSEPLVRELLALGPGHPFRPPEVEARIADLMETYARQGYLDAEATLERLELTDEGVVLGIAVAEGERSVLAEVTVRGNTTTRSDLVQRLAGLGTPQPADAIRIREAPQLLLRSGLFADVGDPVIYRLSPGNRIGVMLPVVESQRRNSVFGALGMARDPSRNGPYLTGSIDLALRNIYGTGRDVSLAWRRDARLGSRLAVGYHERYLLGTPLDFALDLSQTVRDSTSTWQTLALTLAVPLQRTVTFDFGGALDRTVYHIGVQGNTLRRRAHVGLRFATLLREENGARFGNFEFYGEYARRANDLQVAGTVDRSRIDQTIWGGRFGVGVPLALRHVLAGRAEWHVIETDALPVPESELFEFGGAQTLRGYRENQFRGDRVLFGGLEYRYGNPRAARVYTFIDAGLFVRRLGADVRQDGFHIGYGVGLRAAVATGALDLALGLGDEDRSFGAIKLHVSLQQRF